MSTKGDLLRLARQLRGMTQKHAAEQLGLAQAVLSRVENDLIEIDENLLGSAARTYLLPRSFFDITDPVYGPPVSVHTMLRGNSDVTARDIDMITAELNVRLFNIRRFLQNVDYRPTSDIPVLDIEHVGPVEQIASTVRAHWKITEGPIKNLTRMLEKAGIIVGDSNFHGASVSGVTFNAPGTPPIILVNRSHPADRLRFTLAHELGHLVMHRFPTPSMEDEANQFASAFLLPMHEMQTVFKGRKITIELLAALKKEWRVSMQAILMRAKSLDCISENQTRYLFQQFSVRGWRTKEPASLDFAFDPPTVLPSLIKSHVDDLKYAWPEVVELARIREADFNEFYGNLSGPGTPTRPTLRIVN